MSDQQDALWGQQVGNPPVFDRVLLPDGRRVLRLTGNAINDWDTVRRHVFALGDVLSMNFRDKVVLYEVVSFGTGETATFREIDADLHRAAEIILEKEKIDRLYEEQQRIMSDIFMNLVQILSFALVYWSLWPLWQSARMRRWSEARKRILWDSAGEIDERRERAIRANLDAGVPDGYIPMRLFR